MFNRRLLVYPGGHLNPAANKGNCIVEGQHCKCFYYHYPARCESFKITTENTYVNEFVDPNLPRYIGVTGGKTYNMRWVTVEEGSVPEPEYWEVLVYRYNSSSDLSNG